MRFTKLFAAALAATTIAGSALAADLPSRKAPPVAYAPIPVMTWAGLYVGLNAGYTFGSNRTVNFFDFDGPGAAGNGFAAAAAAGVLPVTLAPKRDGFIGGGQIGYNWQFGSFVTGIEADIQGTSAKGTSSAVLGGFLSTIDTKTDYLGTVRARLGFAVSPSFLLYATGGLAYGNTKLSYGVFDPGFAAYNTVSQTKVGYTVGGGVEYALSQNWSLKGEYLYYDLGRQSATILATNGAGAFTTSTASQRNAGHIVRAGVNYRFNFGGAPVVARY